MEYNLILILNPTVRMKYLLWTLDTDQEVMVRELHTGIEGTDRPSSLVENVHPNDIPERHRNGKEARGNQSSNQRTFIRFHSYCDEDQKGHGITEQPNVKSVKAEKIHKASR